MSRQQKVNAERKHRMVNTYLKSMFPFCEVKYNGIEGIDHRITFGNKTTIIETKTCKKFIKSKYNRLGVFKIDNESKYPYKLSQHVDLLNNDGWYVFMVGHRIMGFTAEQIDKLIGNEFKKYYLRWDTLMYAANPNWLTELKKQVYGVE